MKNLLFSLFVLFSFSDFLVAQPSVYNGKVNPLRPKNAGPSSVEELASQLVAGTTKFIDGVNAYSWLEKVKEGANYSIEKIGYLPLKNVEEVVWLVKNSKVVPAKDLNVAKNDILSSGSIGDKLYWINNPAEPEYYLVFFAEGGEFLILAKWDCLNPVCDLRKKESIPTPPQKADDIPYDPPKEEEKKDNRILVGGVIHSGGTEYWFTPSQERFFNPENQEDMRARTWRPERRSNSFCCNGNGLDYSKNVFAKNTLRGGNHGGGKKYYGHR